MERGKHLVSNQSEGRDRQEVHVEHHLFVVFSVSLIKRFLINAQVSAENKREREEGDAD